MNLVRTSLAVAFAAGGAAFAPLSPALADTNPYIGQMMLTAGNYCPKGWLVADGRLLPIAQNVSLFSVVGVSYGGNGHTTFALPDLRGRTPIGYGQGPGLSSHPLGEKGGVEFMTLNAGQIPAHTHGVRVSAGGSPAKPTPGPAGTALAAEGGTGNETAMQTGAAGGAQAFHNMGPFLALTWCVAQVGTFPPRE